MADPSQEEKKKPGHLRRAVVADVANRINTLALDNMDDARTIANVNHRSPTVHGDHNDGGNAQAQHSPELTSENGNDTERVSHPEAAAGELEKMPNEYDLAAEQDVYICGKSFKVGPRYHSLKYLGEGAYGVVVRAQDVTTGEIVAIKKMSPFEYQTFCLRCLREIRILCSLQHENIIDLRNVFCSYDGQRLKDLYLVQTYMECDLARLLRSQKLSEEHVCYFLYQIIHDYSLLVRLEYTFIIALQGRWCQGEGLTQLRQGKKYICMDFLRALYVMRGLKYVHSADVLHRDLKPSNLLINSNCDLKICDFGLARIADQSCDHAGLMTEYVATRWYRAPEVMLCAKAYSKSMDVWSVGCILAEMVGRRALFQGKNYLDQITKIQEILGSPSVPDMEFIKNMRAKAFLASLPPRRKVAWSRLYPTASRSLLDLLDQMLTFDPTSRISVDDAISHYYLRNYHDKNDEPIMAKALNLDLSHAPRESRQDTTEISENPALTTTVQLRQLIVDECKNFKRADNTTIRSQIPIPLELP